ncbi:MAG: phospho-N-acetylmuramoyl-pentapeptide-transferase [Phycisphaerae bacterium]|nr:phospho-N-acetylmuramoyl-pentapeptide-transferase [Phycisphaerae bacterium]
MLYHFFYWLTDGNVNYAYGSPWFRAVIAVLVAFVIVWALGPPVIRKLIQFKIGDRPEFDHAALNRMTQAKENTPTMGGVLIAVAIAGAVLLLADLSNFYTTLGLFCLVWLAVLGGVDDWLKLTADRRAGTRDGLRLWEKLVFQVALGVMLAIFIYRYGAVNLEEVRYLDVDAYYSPNYNVLNIPFYKHALTTLSMPAFYIIAVIVIAGTSNAVNLTDGMDGLASGCMAMTSLAFMVLAIVIGSHDLSVQLGFRDIQGADELAVLCGAVLGACLGFLWYNAYPARVFMGDTGALPLGGLMGYVAIVTRLELWLFIVGGVFVIEAVSVLLQISHYKTTGRRLFRCAPLHHHYHLAGLSETQVVMRFWLLAALFAAFALATIKLR